MGDITNLSFAAGCAECGGPWRPARRPSRRAWKEERAMADVEVTNNTERHRFELNLDGEVAFAEYNLVDHGIILPHTLVPESFEGKGVASALAKTALGYAREHGLKVIPTCPFMSGYIQKHPEWHDIVHDSFKAKLGIP
jgi:predicted GNAT family acetyltransferase